MTNIDPYFKDTTPAMRWVMQLSVGGNLLVIAFCAGYLIFNFSSSGLPWFLIVVALLIGYFVADFASGLIHWGMDTWFDERLLGRAIAIAREHHTHPQHILGYGFLEHATLGSAPSAVFVGFAAIVTSLFPVSGTTYLVMIVWIVTSTCLFFGTSFHNLCHLRSRSPIVKLAQRLRLVCTPEHHWVHHRGDQTIRYCVINGWANYVCDTLRVWRGLERLVSAITNAEPRRDDIVWQTRYRTTGRLIADPE